MTKSCGPYNHIVITGASGGIGAALARIYAAAGVVLTLTGRDEKRLCAVAELCEKAGARVHPAPVDVTDEKAMRDILLQADERAPVDLLIANAGISAGTGGVPEGESPPQVRLIFDVNLHGVLNTITPLLPEMIARGRGQIALMSSLAGWRGWPGAPAYCASKAAVKIYGESLRGALSGTGVKVSVICPGFVESQMTAVNDFPMPFLVSAEKAARIIRRGLEKDRSRISFPFPAVFFSWWFAVLPDALVQKLLGKTPSKRGASA